LQFLLSVSLFFPGYFCILTGDYKREVLFNNVKDSKKQASTLSSQSTPRKEKGERQNLATD
jgi:hypothetical protein